jgi:hypothetical protein
MRETFNVRVEVLDCNDNKTAIAKASMYLAYGDQTDTVGYSPVIHDVAVHSDSTGPIGVTFRVTLSVGSDQDLKRFMDELATMSKVQSVERL